MARQGLAIDRPHAYKQRMSVLRHFLTAMGLSPQKALLLCCDLAALVGAAFLIFICRTLLGNVSFDTYVPFFLTLFLLAPPLGLCFGLYQGVSLPPYRELKALWLTSTLTYAVILGHFFMAQSGDIYSRAVVAGSWLVSLLTLPLFRGLCRRHCGKRLWWRHPMVIFDTGSTALHLREYLQAHPERGLEVVNLCALPTEDAEREAALHACAMQWPQATALVVLRESDVIDDKLLSAVRRVFGRVLVLPEWGLSTYWLTPRDLGLGIGLLIRQNLRDRKRLALKRFLDIALCVLAFPLLFPLFVLLALLIRLDSPGPVIYRQQRLGRGGRIIHVCKFRTMVENADEVLKGILERDASLQEEWAQDHKLKHDPRITRIGVFLRKTSLDELPQLINVVTGDMSLVGPRPIVEAEVAKYGDVYEDYCCVRPGITGLWQISGRNNTTYEERVSLDQYYISNWSVWMDIWILGRTVPVVLTGYGAY